MSELAIIIPRGDVEGMARIAGPGSGASAALAAADSGEYGSDPVFFRPLSDPGSLIVSAREDVPR
jgi:hypothetical protein